MASFPGDQYQRDNAANLIAVGKEVGATDLAFLSMLCLGWGENNMRADGCNSSNHCGLFQLSGTLQAEHDYHDVRYWARRAYLNGFWSHGGILPLAKANPSWSPGYITNLCQGAYSDLTQGANYYNQYLSLAHTTLQALAGISPAQGGAGGTPAPTSGETLGQLLKAYNPSTIIRHDFYRLGAYGHHAAGHAIAIRRLAERTRFCTTKGPTR